MSLTTLMGEYETLVGLSSYGCDIALLVLVVTNFLAILVNHWLWSKVPFSLSHHSCLNQPKAHLKFTLSWDFLLFRMIVALNVKDS